MRYFWDNPGSRPNRSHAQYYSSTPATRSCTAVNFDGTREIHRPGGAFLCYYFDLSIIFRSFRTVTIFVIIRRRALVQVYISRGTLNLPEMPNTRRRTEPPAIREYSRRDALSNSYFKTIAVRKCSKKCIYFTFRPTSNNGKVSNSRTPLCIVRYRFLLRVR